MPAATMQLPVSTTHSIVGAIVGMSVTAKGFDSVVWYEHKSTFPYIGGVAGITLSWVFSPILSALAAIIIFLGVRTAVLRRQNSYFLSLWLLPLFTAITFWITAFFIVQKVSCLQLPQWARLSLDADRANSLIPTGREQWQ